MPLQQAPGQPEDPSLAAKCASFGVSRPARRVSQADPRRTVLASVSQERPMPLIETDEAARRLARAIASDLSLYNEDKIINGITNDNLFESLAEEIEEGRALYKRRVSPELYPKNFYDRALVDILIKAKGHIKSKIW
jgi:hypothetical protein